MCLIPLYIVYIGFYKNKGLFTDSDLSEPLFNTLIHVSRIKHYPELYCLQCVILYYLGILHFGLLQRAYNEISNYEKINSIDELIDKYKSNSILKDKNNVYYEIYERKERPLKIEICRINAYKNYISFKNINNRFK